MAYKTIRNRHTGQLELHFYTKPRGSEAHRGMTGQPPRRVLRIDWATSRHYHATKGWRGGPCPQGPAAPA